jgi:hypothetical protein
MNDFFDRLELELHAAAERPPRRGPDWRPAARSGGVALVVAAVLALVLIPVLVVTGGGDGEEAGDRGSANKPEAKAALPVVGTVVPKGVSNRESDSTIVATGRAPVAGAWQLEVWRGSGVKDPKTGEVYLRAGGDCLGIVLLEPPDPHLRGPSGYCSPNRKLGFRKTPGFSRQQHTVTAGRREPGTRRMRAEEILVFGVVPKRASAVVLSSPRVRIRARPHAGPKGQRRDFYVIAIPPDFEDGRINWIDAHGNEGSRGISLLPF